MARTKKAAPGGVASQEALAADDGSVIPRIKLDPVGFIGLRTSNRAIIEEQNRAFRFPAFIKTVNEMRNSPTVGSAMNVYRMMISRVKWDVNPPVGATQIEIERASLVRSMMDDMDHSWGSFIESIVPYLEYGFGVNEKVFRRRLKRNGSKWNDGIVGLRSLPTRSQDTIIGWLFSQDGSELVAIAQTLSYMEHGYLFMDRTDERGQIQIPREKILLFSASANKGNFQGNSIYKNIYLAFKQLSLLQDQELLSCAKSVQGILKIAIPPKYLAADASPEDQAVAASFKAIIDNYNAGTQRGLLVPNMIDPESKLPMFTYDLMESKGTQAIDIEMVIKRLQNNIMQALSCDVLSLGSDGTGSFSLAESKSSVLALAIDYRLKEISEVLNSDLMRSIYEMNGWETTRMAEFAYDDIEQVDLETLGKFIQQAFSVGAIEADREVMNRVRQLFGVSQLPDDEPVNVDILPPVMTGKATSAGKGMQNGTSGTGTGKDPFGGGDPSTANANNK